MAERRGKFDMGVDPHQPDIVDLVISDRLEDRNCGGKRQEHDRAPLGAAQWRSRLAVAFARPLVRQITLAGEVGDGCEEHQHAGAAEADMPAIELCEQSADDRPERRTDIDPGAEDRECAGAARYVVWGVKVPDLRGDIALQAARSGDQQQQRDQEALLERHREMSGAHHQRADHNRLLRAQQPVGDPAAEQRREIDEAGVETERLRRERLARHGSEDGFKRRPVRGHSGDMLDVPRQQQLLDHVEHDQGGHPVIGKSLPRFREREKRQPLRMSEKAAVFCTAHLSRFRSYCCRRHGAPFRHRVECFERHASATIVRRGCRPIGKDATEVT